MNHPAVAPDRPSSVIERLADEMASRWEAGDRPLAEDLLTGCPELAGDPEAVLDLVAEELALRHEYGAPLPADELAARFPHLADRVRALAECQRVFGPRPEPPEFPAPGEALGEFRLLAELGRGAVGRVFLATQPSLAGRPVVLKVTPLRGDEHLTLARLQHTHIVPLYSAHEFPDLRVRALCMPYFGGAALADLLAGPGRRPRTGAELVAALAESQATSPVPVPVEGPGCQFLGQVALAEAVCWLGACLADALQYAHDRGVLHLDLKPSNVLIAADGTPMLLDFHLARQPLRPGDPPPEWLGGTPGFAPPEQAAVVRAVRDGRPVPAAVDGRADVYALGVLLTAALGAGRGAWGRGAVGLSDILARCTAADPADRYPAAADLAADLRRHLADLPLRGVANRSLAERWRKWRRRRPLALPLGLALAALAAGGGAWATYAGRQAGAGRAALRDGEDHLAGGRYAEAVETFQGGEALVRGLPFDAGLGDRLRDGRRRAELGQAAAALHHLAERVRPLYGAEVVTPEQARAAAAACRAVWDRREALAWPGAPRPAGLGGRWRDDLADLGIVASHLAVRTAPPGGEAAARAEALAILGQAEALFGPSRVLHLERAAHARASGASQLAEEEARRAEAVPARSAWEHAAAGRAYLTAGDARRAAAELDRALALDPGSPWANYHRGVCSLRLGEPADAVAAFSACVALAPHSAWCRHNRGLAFAAVGRLDRARADFDQALALDPGLVAALLARAAVNGRDGRLGGGFADVREAEARGAPPADVEYHRAGLHLAAGDPAAAAASLRRGLAADPAHHPSLDLLTQLSPDR